MPDRKLERGKEGPGRETGSSEALQRDRGSTVYGDAPVWLKVTKECTYRANQRGCPVGREG